MVDVILMNCPMVLSIKEFGDATNFEMVEGDESSNTPLGILYIASYLEKHGISVKILDIAPQKLTLNAILKMISDEKPAIVGISSLTPGIRSAVQIADAIKNEIKEAPLIGIGGAHVNCDPTFINRHQSFDFCVIGEGEIVMLDIIKRVLNGEKVSGIIQGKLIENLDDLPFPARHLINEQYYHRDEDKSKVPAATIMGSRGCPFKCNFCSRPAYRRIVRFRSTKNIVDEMEQISESCGGKFSFVDDTLTFNKKKIIDICREIISRGLKVQWMGQTRASHIDEEVLNYLRKAGCIDLFIGVESGNEQIRNNVINKNVTDQQIFKAVELCRKYGIHTNLFLMIGFPGETMKEINDTVNFGLRAKADMIGIRLTVPLPGSEIFEYAIREGMIDRNVIDRYANGELGVGFTGVWPVFIPKGLALEQLINAKKRTYKKFYTNPFWILRRINLYIHSTERLKYDLKLLKVAPQVFLKGKTKTSMS